MADQDDHYLVLLGGDLDDRAADLVALLHNDRQEMFIEIDWNCGVLSFITSMFDWVLDELP